MPGHPHCLDLCPPRPVARQTRQEGQQQRAANLAVQNADGEDMIGVGVYRLERAQIGLVQRRRFAGLPEDVVGIKRQQRWKIVAGRRPNEKRISRHAPYRID